MVRRWFADRDERPVRRPFGTADAPHGMALEMAVDVRKAPFVILIDYWRHHSLQIELEHQVRSGIVPVVAVPHLDDEIVAVRAVDESFTGEPIRLVVGLRFLSQPDVLGNEMKRRYRRSLAATVGHET